LDLLAREGFNGVGLSGGEPLLYPQLFPLLQRARERGMITTVTSGGRSPARSISRTFVPERKTLSSGPAGLVLLVWGRRISRIQAGSAAPEAKPRLTAAQRKRVVVATLIGVLVALGYQLLMGSLPPSRQQAPPAPDQPVGPSDASGLGLTNVQPHNMPQAGLGTYLTAFAALAALAALVIVLLRRTQVVELGSEDEVAPAEAVARAVAAGRAAVQDRAIRDPRQAIVACFAAMEDALAGLGGAIAPRDADTPSEVLSRGVAGASIPAQPAAELLRLFRVARFSTHPVGEADRASADRALTAILASLDGAAERAR